jgi:hypothetical protein
VPTVVVTDPAGLAPARSESEATINAVQSTTSGQHSTS